MNSEKANLLDAIDEAVNPGLLAKRRNQIADRKHAEEEAVRLAPSPSRAAYAVIAKRVKFELEPKLIEFLTVLKAEWRAAYDAAMAHTHIEARAAYDAHRTEIESAGTDTETLRGLRIQTREEIAADFMAKMKSANRQCAVISAKINSFVAPVRAELADAIEHFAWQVELDEESLANSLGLERGQSPVVLQLKKAVLNLRTTAMQLNPNSDATVEITDFV